MTGRMSACHVSQLQGLVFRLWAYFDYLVRVLFILKRYERRAENIRFLDSPVDVGCADGRFCSHSTWKMMGKERSAYIGCFYSFAAIVLLLVAALVLGACRSVRYVPVESVRNDTLYMSLYQRDSIYQHDSIHIKEKADTILVERWHTRWRDRVTHDTVYISKGDTIRIPVPVERKLSKVERTYITIGKWSVGVVAGLILAAICFVFFRRRWKFCS